MQPTSPAVSSDADWQSPSTISTLSNVTDTRKSSLCDRVNHTWLYLHPGLLSKLVLYQFSSFLHYHLIFFLFSVKLLLLITLKHSYSESRPLFSKFWMAQVFSPLHPFSLLYLSLSVVLSKLNLIILSFMFTIVHLCSGQAASCTILFHLHSNPRR